MTDNEIIKALKSEIHLTEYKVIKEQNKNSKLRNERNRLQAEIERLNELLETRHKVFETKCEELEIAKAEAYKEFAEKLKKKCYEDFEETDEMLAPYVTEDNIDNLLKEMAGEDNAEEKE